MDKPSSDPLDLAEARRLARAPVPSGRGGGAPSLDGPTPVAGQTERIAELEDELATLRASTSWRMTAPVRAVLDRLRGRCVAGPRSRDGFLHTLASRLRAVVALLVRVAAGLLRRLRAAMKGAAPVDSGTTGTTAATDASEDTAASTADWPVPQLPGGARGGVLVVCGPGTAVPEGAQRAHPNRLRGAWSRLVVHTAACSGPGPWAGAFGPCGAPLTAALERLAATVGRVEVREDATAEQLAAAGVDVDRLRDLATRGAA